MHSGVFLFPIFIIPMVNIKIILIITQKDFFPNQILKKSLAKKIDKFLKILEEMFKKKNSSSTFLSKKYIWLNQNIR